MSFAYRALTFFGRPFQDRFARQIATCRSLRINGHLSLSTPIVPHKSEACWVWALPFSLAATKGMGLVADETHVNPRVLSLTRHCFLFLRVLKCFTSPGALPGLHRDLRGLHGGVSPFGHRRIKGCSAPPRRLSQLRHVLHRLSKPRHPPYTLNFPLRSKSSFESGECFYFFNSGPCDTDRELILN